MFRALQRRADLITAACCAKTGQQAFYCTLARRVEPFREGPANQPPGTAAQHLQGSRVCFDHSLRLGIDDHRSQLQELEVGSVLPDAGLAEENRAAVAELHDERRKR